MRWMYESRAHGESYSNDVFIVGVNKFVQTAVSNGYLSNDNTMRCPCTKCKNRRFINIRMLEEHFYKYGFTLKYYNWTLHGEDLAEITYAYACPNVLDPSTVDPFFTSHHDIFGHAGIRDMVHDFSTPNDIPKSSNIGDQQIENAEANRFFDLLNSSSEPAYEGCTTETELSINIKMLATKANYRFS
ncbi:unnamed protein product [Rhodiola kirilowii]